MILSASTNFYNGVKAHEVRRATGIFILQSMARNVKSKTYKCLHILRSYYPGEELRLPVSCQDYLSKLVEYGMMKLHAAASVKETNQSWVEEDDFQVLMPNVNIIVSSCYYLFSFGITLQLYNNAGDGARGQGRQTSGYRIPI